MVHPIPVPKLSFVICSFGTEAYILTLNVSLSVITRTFVSNAKFVA
jgi:hypothetical protein